jgi:hypothetical protein
VRQRDDHDIRVVKETLNGTYTYKGSVSGKPGLPDNEAGVGGYESYPTTTRDATWDSDGDGLPDWWEKGVGLSPSSAAGNVADSNADADGNGYTQLDDYLPAPRVRHTVAGAIVLERAGGRRRLPVRSAERAHGRRSVRQQALLHGGPREPRGIHRPLRFLS